MNIISIQTTRLLRSLTLLCSIFFISGTMAWGQYSGGTGTETDPFQIANETDLTALATAVNGGTGYKSTTYFRQTTNIELTNEWIPIGHESNAFNGNYDGNGKKISNMKVINTPSSTGYYDIGLFGSLSGSVKNLTLVKPEIVFSTSRSPYVGFIAGRASSSIISNCKITDGNMSITTTSREYIYAGGIVGYEGYEVRNCSFTNTIIQAYSNYSGKDQCQVYIGGIAGNNTLRVNNCSFSGKVIALVKKASLYAGGIGGSIGEIKSCTVQGFVQAINTNSSGNVGGIAGGASSIVNCISQCSEVVGLIKGSIVLGRISNNYKLIDNLAIPTMKKRIYNGTSNLETIFTSLAEVTDQNIADCSKEEAAISSSTDKDGADFTYSTVENIFTNIKQGNGSGADATNPAPVGNKDGLKMYGTYTASNNYPVTITSDGNTTETTLPLIAGNWVLTKTNGSYTNLREQAPMLWLNDRPNATPGILFTDNTTLDKPVAFAPEMSIILTEGKTFTLSAEGDSSYALPALSLPNTTADIALSQPKALAYVEQLKVKATLPAKDGTKLYANLSMPFDYNETVLTEATYVTYNAANRADKGTAGQMNWKSIAGKNWHATRGDSDSILSYTSKTPSEALVAIRGGRYDKDGTEIQEKLAYAHGVTAEKSAAWKNAHFGWNIVNSGSIRAKDVTLSDPKISVIQFLTAEGGYTTVVKNTVGNTAAFALAPYTAYFAQATGDNQTTNGLLRSGEENTVTSAVLELIAKDGTVCDRILATAGEALPGRNVEKMGIGQHNLYIDKAGMKCASTDKEGRFEVKVSNAGKPNTNNLRLASLTSGETATWNGVTIRTGETFAATNGTLVLKGTSTANEPAVTANIRAWGIRGNIVIEVAEAGTTYRIITSGGKDIASGTATNNRTLVPVSIPGIYFIVIGDYSVKAIVK